MIQIKEWERDAEDYNGKQHAEVFYVLVNGKEKAVGKADLLRMAKMTLPERGTSDEPTDERNGRLPEVRPMVSGND